MLHACYVCLVLVENATAVLPDACVTLVQIAKRQAVVNPEDTFFSVKRFIGSKYSEVKTESTQVPYRVIEDSTGNVKITSKNASKDFAPEEISAQVLRKLVDDAGVFSTRDHPGKAAVAIVLILYQNGEGFHVCFIHHFCNCRLSIGLQYQQRCGIVVECRLVLDCAVHGGMMDVLFRREVPE